jgi:hypothetical protein
MKSLCYATLLCIASAFAGELMPPDLVGIWAADGSEFRGDAIVKGSASEVLIYDPWDWNREAIRHSSVERIVCRWSLGATSEPQKSKS